MLKFFKYLSASIVVMVVSVIVYAYPRYQVPIVMYHTIAPTDEKKFNTISPDMFEKQIAFLKKQNYRVLSLQEYVQGLSTGKKFPRNSVVITFDDGYRDTFTTAYPVLKKYQFPATVFVISDLVNDPKFLTAQQVKILDQEGWTIGNHSKSHEYLPLLSFPVLQEQLVKSKETLEKIVGHRIEYFSYPCGGYSQAVVATLQAAGYKAAVTTNRGVKSVPLDFFALKRIRVNSTDSELVLKAKLSGYYNLFRKPKAPYKSTDVDVTCPCKGTPAE